MRYVILVATDGSQMAKKAEMAAIRIAKSYNVSIAAMYVAVTKKDSEREELVAKGERVLKEVVDVGEQMGVDIHKVLMGVSMRTMSKKGARANAVAMAILDAAEKYDVHTIVVGSKGESEINPELGSVALEVVKKARCTVLVAR